MGTKGSLYVVRPLRLAGTGWSCAMGDTHIRRRRRTKAQVAEQGPAKAPSLPTCKYKPRYELVTTTMTLATVEDVRIKAELWNAKIQLLLGLFPLIQSSRGNSRIWTGGQHDGLQCRAWWATWWPTLSGMAGHMMAYIVGHGGPAPQFLSETAFSCLLGKPAVAVSDVIDITLRCSVMQVWWKQCIWKKYPYFELNMY